ncbi:2-iminobutanoate/2-iminopropanoate deaminase [Neorhizobium galegae]|uniref:RidA family protein n=1 Tax=Neorhizobium galegae TaxID=399 RepID=UPI001AEB563F|nr:RidA family protein [Neorhizobium galegae]MBP2561319.1 2-iminobutanoate/2-iminopropanoate deaminase [Neorhizobium galegae]MDQ0134317.1 2-iminobutanoate/2-iminopropanoate deaminase [Neorhizobium galegae]
MHKQIIKADVPENGGAYNLCVRYGDMLYLSGLAPFDAAFCAVVAAARAAGTKVPPMPDTPFSRQVEIVMENIKKLVEAAGSNMDCLLKTNVWLRDQTQAEEFEKVYIKYFSSHEALPARARMQAGRTPMDCGLEIEVIAYVPNDN